MAASSCAANWSSPSSSTISSTRASATPRSPRCNRVNAAGVESFYLEAGRPGAPRVIMLHGLGATSASFLPTLWDLARDHHVTPSNLPGFGESGKPVRPLHAAYFARWLVALWTK